MIRRLFLVSAALLSLAIVAPVTVIAQDFFISGGAAFPSGDGADGIDTGWLVVGGVSFDIGENLRAGVEGSYGRHTTEFFAPNSVKPFSVMAFLGYSFPTEGNLDPYVFGGAGLAGINRSPFDTFTEFGYEGGLGLVFGNETNSVRPYVEGRFQGSGGDIDAQLFSVLLGIIIGTGD